MPILNLYMKITLLVITLSIIFAIVIGNLYFLQLRKVSCFGLIPESFSYSQYVKEIKKNAQLILEPDNKDYFNDLKKFLYYNVWIDNNLQVLVKVSNPKYEKMHQVILADINDRNFKISFNERKQIENMARVEEIIERDFVALIPLEVTVAPGGMVIEEYNSVNGIACVYAEPNSVIRLPLYINNFLKIGIFIKNFFS